MQEETPQDKEQSAFKNDWKNPPSLSDLKADFELTKPSHDRQVSRVNEYLANMYVSTSEVVQEPTNPFQQNSHKKKGKTRSTIQPKLIRKQAEWRYTSLSEPFLNTPDVFNVDPARGSDEAAAQQNGLVLNNQINTKLDKVNFIDAFIRSCVDEGTVVVNTN